MQRTTPALPKDDIKTCFSFTLEHDVELGLYLDPIQKNQIAINDVIEDATVIQSGHITPLNITTVCCVIIKKSRLQLPEVGIKI